MLRHRTTDLPHCGEFATVRQTYNSLVQVRYKQVNMERDGVKDLFAIEFSLRARGLQERRMILKADEKKEREWYFFLKKVGATFAPIQYDLIEVDQVDKVASELEVLLKERMLKEYLQGNYLYCYELQRQQAEIEAGLAHYG